MSPKASSAQKADKGNWMSISIYLLLPPGSPWHHRQPHTLSHAGIPTTHMHLTPLCHSLSPKKAHQSRLAPCHQCNCSSSCQSLMDASSRVVIQGPGCADRARGPGRLDSKSAHGERVACQVERLQPQECHLQMKIRALVGKWGGTLVVRLRGQQMRVK